MSELQDNPDAWHEQLAKQEALLEQQKNAAKEKKERSWGFNMGVLKRMYKDKKLDADTRIGELKKIESYNNRHPHLKDSGQDKSLDTQIAKQKKSYEQDAVLFRLFKHLDESMSHIENVITTMDERLTHIERFLTDDIQKEEFLKNSSQNERCQTVAEALDVADTWTKAVKEEIDKRVQNKLGDNHMPPEPWYDSI